MNNYHIDHRKYRE
jgi:hypothetical protein